jgi:hypothetical protein
LLAGFVIAANTCFPVAALTAEVDEGPQLKSADQGGWQPTRRV